MGLTLFLYTIVIVSSLVFITVYLSSGHISKRVIAGSRVGPHNIDIIRVFSGALLGDAHAERRVSGNGTRISFTQESN